MFLTGADIRMPEVRTPSFKGAMRFWWRAVQAEDSIKQLRERETMIFGGVGQKSSFFIRILIKEIHNGWYRPLPHHIGDGCPYCDKPCAKAKGKEQRAIIDAQFSILLGYAGTRRDITLNELNALFLLTSTLGGVGKRSRRGFGSYQVVSVDDKKQSATIDLQYILSLLDTLAPNKYMISDSCIISKNQEEHFYPCIEEITIGKPERDKGLLLEKIGRASHDNNSSYTGRGNPRLASPVYVSVIYADSFYFPVVTTLTTICTTQLTGSNTQAAFKEAVLW